MDRIERKPARKGFTLIELMIVVAIIGILAAISIPNFIRFQCRAKQSESKEILKAMYITQVTYNGEFGNYLDVTQLTGFGGLDPTTLNGAKYYSFATTLTGAGLTFLTTAQDTLQKIMTQGPADEWIIDESDPRPLNVHDACYE